MSQMVMSTGAPASMFDMGASGMRAMVRPMATGRRAGIRWGRLLVVVSAVLLAAVAVAAAGAALSSARAGSAPVRQGDGAVVASADAALREHVVAPGDTLWQLAVTAVPDADPRETVDRIIRLNGLAGAEVEVGRVLVMPR